MANEQTSVPLYAAAEVLTAANMNISAGTGVPVFATTVTRDAAFGGAGEKVLAEGQLCYLSSTNVVQYYDGAAWATVGPAVAPSSGLAFVTSAAVSGTSFSINNCFSATYTNYRIIYNFTVADENMTFRLRVGGSDNSTSNYGRQRLYCAATAVQGARTTGATSWTDYLGSDGASFWIMDIFSPFLAAKTSAWLENGYNASTDPAFNLGSLQQQQTTSFDGFTIAGANTMTGTCYVYGYSLS